jgi:hypothetical protein
MNIGVCLIEGDSIRETSVVRRETSVVALSFLPNDITFHSSAGGAVFAKQEELLTLIFVYISALAYFSHFLHGFAVSIMRCSVVIGAHCRKLFGTSPYFAHTAPTCGVGRTQAKCGQSEESASMGRRNSRV